MKLSLFLNSACLACVTPSVRGWVSVSWCGLECVNKCQCESHPTDVRVSAEDYEVEALCCSREDTEAQGERRHLPPVTP